MCGRYAAAKDVAELVTEFAVEQEPSERLAADYNVAPTKEVYVVGNGRDEDEDPAVQVRKIRVARWGLIPSWAKDPKIGSRLINARWETAADKPAFRAAFRKRRCIVPADGYYEWYVSDDPDAPRLASGKPKKQPFYIRRQDGHSLAMAGLMEFWRDPADEDAPWRVTNTILTTTSTDELGQIHDRSPVLVPSDNWADWLDKENTDPADILPLAGVAAPGELEAFPVSTAVNNVRNNGPELRDPLTLDH